MQTRHLIDINTAARMTGLDKSTLYRLARQRRIHTYTPLGRALRFDLEEVSALVRVSDWTKKGEAR